MRETLSAPKVKETPRSLSPQPELSRSGSDQRRSQRRPTMVGEIGREPDAMALISGPCRPILSASLRWLPHSSIASRKRVSTVRML